LLTQDRTISGLDLRQNGKEIVISGAIVVNITDMVEFSKQYDIALRNRSTASTKLNQESSRSHFILQLSVRTHIGQDKYLSSKVHLIDLVRLILTFRQDQKTTKELEILVQEWMKAVL
jgi:hypothetical protein